MPIGRRSPECTPQLLGQAQAVSYVEVYWLLRQLSVLMFFLSFLLAKNDRELEAKLQCIREARDRGSTVRASPS